MRTESLHGSLSFFPDIDGFWNFQSWTESESQILARLPENWATEWTSRSIEILTQLARAQGLQGKLAEARSTLDQVRHQIDTNTSQSFGAIVEVRWSLELGRVLYLSMSPVKAHDLFVRAWKIACENSLDFFAVDAALMMSTVRPPKFQNEWLQKAYTLANTSSDKQVRLWLSQLLYLEGWHAFDFRQFERALKCFEDALSQPHSTDDPSRMMAMQWSRGRALRALGQIEQAMSLQKSLLNEMSLKGNISGYVYLEIAECQQLLQQTELARSNFELAYKELSVPGWYADNRVDELDRMQYLFKKR